MYDVHAANFVMHKTHLSQSIQLYYYYLVDLALLPSHLSLMFIELIIIVNLTNHYHC